MIFVFNVSDGSFHHATSIIDKFYGNSSDHVYIDVQDFDLEYEYSYVNGEVVKGDKWSISDEDAAALEADRLANIHVQARIQAYPRIKDQLDDLYHNGIDGWKQTIKAIKDAHPKN